MAMPGLARLVDDIADDEHGLIMVMGKGGVGKPRWQQPRSGLSATRVAGAPHDFRSRSPFGRNSQ